MKIFLLVFVLGSLISLTAQGEPRRFNLPKETGTYKTAPGVQLAQALCLNCHSTEYCESQPPLPEKYWEGAVKKMKEKFGATIPDEAIPELVNYLVSAYGAPPK